MTERHFSAPAPKVIVIGAGLAGLACARLLQRQGLAVEVFEAEPQVGGRVRSEQLDGYVLDRGFQVLFDAYPAVRHILDLAALELRPFDPGAIICWQGRRTVLTDPRRDRCRRDVVEALRTPIVPLADKLRVLRLGWRWRAADLDQRAEPDTRSTLDELRALGFQPATIDRFFRPFFGGIFLERELRTTAAVFRFYFRMLNLGRAVLPARGMGAIAEQLAAPLRAAGALHTATRVAALQIEAGQVVGVRLADGQTHQAVAVVVATDGATAAQLLPPDAAVQPPRDWLGVTAVYFAGTRAPFATRKILLNAAPDALVNNAQLLSNVAPSYAPQGRHLLSATILGVPAEDDATLAGRALEDLRRMLAGNQRALAALDTFHPLRVYRIAQAQFAQPPGSASRRPVHATALPGLFVAGEWTDASSIHGALTSGERCAAEVVRTVRAAGVVAA